MSKFFMVCKKYECENRMVVARYNSTLSGFVCNIQGEDKKLHEKLMDVQNIQDYIISAIGLSYQDFMEKYLFLAFDIKKISIGVRRINEKK